MKKILQIDGGGIKGVLPATILAALENDIGKPCHQIFDLITGSSTGAIIGGCLAAGVPAEQIRGIYVEHGKELFTPQPLVRRIFGSPKYDRTPFMGALVQYIGERRMNECKTKLMVTAYGLCANRTHFIKSWDDGDVGLKIVDAVTWSALSAAYYFGKIPAPNYQWGYMSPDGNWNVCSGEIFQDGGQGIFNNTLTFALTEMMANTLSKDQSEQYLICSLGCGDSVDIDAYGHEQHMSKWGQVVDYSIRNQARRESTIQQVMSADYIMKNNPHKLLFCRFNSILPSAADELDAITYVPLFQEKARELIDGATYKSMLKLMEVK